MDASGQLVGQNTIHHPVTFNPALAGEYVGADHDLEMRLAALAPAGMAGMLVTDIKNLDLAW